MHRRAHVLQAVRDADEQEPPILGQLDSRIIAPKQAAPELLLELSHLMADRTLRDSQLVGSLREAEIPRHGLESSQPRQGRKERRSSSQTKPHE